MVYQIRVKGKLDQSWSDWLGNAKVISGFDEYDGVVTTLTVELADQPALFGILDRMRDMNLLPLTIERIDREK